MVTASTKEELFKQETDKQFVTLVTISHDVLDEPIRVCDDHADITSRGNLFVALAFTVTFGEDAEDTVPKARLRIDNVDRRITEAVRSITTRPSVTIEVVRKDDPDTLEMALEDYKITEVDYNAMEVSGEVSLENFLLEPYPSAVFDPGRFPGGFA